VTCAYFNGIGVKAQAHGYGRHGELVLLGRREFDGLEEPVPELAVLVTEGLGLPDQFLRGRSAAVAGLDGDQDLLGMVVDALAATTGLASLLGDGAIGVGEAGGGIGDPTEEGYGRHGDGSSWVSGSQQPHP
jgi:hypothetical protein